MTESYSDLVGKRVVLQYTPEGAEEVEDVAGTLVQASSGGILFRPKGRQADLIMSEQIVSLSLDESVDTRLKPKRLNPVADNAVRQHLADRHGMKLSDVNNLSDADAVKLHDDLHSSDTAKEISHYHKEKRTAAKADASPGSDGD